jgi:LPS sulfotransferase NodH
MKKFCILTTQRSGSTWVVDSIQKSTRSKGVFGEPFLDRPAKSKDPWSEPHGNLVPPVRYYDWRKKTGAFFLTAPKLYLTFLELYAHKEEVFGFKLMYDHLIRKPFLARQLKHGGYSMINLVRKNLLDVYISSQHRHTRKTKAHVRADDELGKKTFEPLSIDPSDAYRYIRKAMWREKIAKTIVKSAGLSMERIEYELLVKSDLDQIEKLNRVIGQPIDLFSKEGFKKMLPRKTSEKITNYNEVVGYFEKKKLGKIYYGEPTDEKLGAGGEDK